MVEPFSGWIASLADGRTVFETPPEAGQLSPWQQLIRSGEKITMLRLQLSGITVMSVPNADGYVQCTRLVTRRITTSTQRGIGSVFGDHVVMTWVDEGRNVWPEIVPLAAYRVHSTLRE